jgi:hypothetical protein
MKFRITILFTISFCIFAISLSFHDYLGTRVIASAEAKNGDTFRVTQRWNGALDGYITDLVHTNPAGYVTTINLDGDDERYSEAPILFDEDNQSITVILSQGREKRISYLTITAEQASPVHPATRPKSKPEGSDKPQPEAEGRSR